MKKTLCLLLCALFLAAALLVPSSVGSAQNNDPKYDTYKNMNPVDDGHPRYVVPNLYRQDASYNNVKMFPLVVNGGVDYFPLDIFAQFNYLEVVYTKLGYGFYIHNTKNHRYVLFNLESNITTTDENLSVDLAAQIFNQTHYVPAKAVCDLLGMTFESYDDPVGGIRAARISDSKASKTLNELIVMYSPTKIEPPSVTPPTDETPPPTDEVPPETPPVTPVDPYLSAAPRSLYLLFTGAPDGYTSAVLDTLAAHGLTGIFVLDQEHLTADPPTVRRIHAAGHLIAVTAETFADGAPRKADDVLADLDEAASLLTLITKHGAHAVYLGGSSGEVTDELLASRGFYRLPAGQAAGDAAARENDAYRALLAVIVNTTSTRAQNITLRFGETASTARLLERLCEFADDYSQFTFLAPDDFTHPAA